MIPLVKKDFTFAAICEEMGIIFAVCLVLLCMALYLLIVSIAVRLENTFYKLIALGLGVEYAFQVFLTVGGTTKFIPMTGVTLPLVSYGGSSLMCTMFMLAIIQGLYIIRHDEDPFEEPLPEELEEMEEEAMIEEMIREEEERARREAMMRQQAKREAMMRQQQRPNGRQNINEDFFRNTELPRNEGDRNGYNNRR